MFEVKVDSTNNQVFYTEGLNKEFGCEFKIVLDKLTAVRVGESTANKWFNLLVNKLEGLIIEDNLILYDFTFKETTESPGQIKILSTNKAILKRVDNSTTLYQLILADPRGYFPWEEGCSTEWVNQV